MMKSQNLIVAVLITAFISLNMLLVFSHKSDIPKSVYISDYERLVTDNYTKDLEKEGFIAPKDLHTIYVKEGQTLDSWLVQEGESVDAGAELASLKVDDVDSQRTQLNAELTALQNQSSAISQTISDLEYEQSISGGSKRKNDYYDSNDENKVRVNLNVDVEVIEEGTFSQAIADAKRDLAKVQREIATLDSKIAELPSETAMTTPVSGYVVKINRDTPSVDIYSTDQTIVTYVLDKEWPKVEPGELVTIQHDSIRTPFIPPLPAKQPDAVGMLQNQKAVAVSADGTPPRDVLIDDEQFDGLNTGDEGKIPPVKLEPGEENFDGTSGNPDGSMDNPDGSITNPDGTLSKPNEPNDTTTKTAPENTPNSEGTLNPDGSITNPDGSVINPDGTINNPDGSITNPDGTISNPDGTTTQTDGAITNPDGTLNDGTPPPGAPVQTQTAKERKLAEVRDRIQPDYPTEISTLDGVVISVAKVSAKDDKWLKAYKSLGNTQKSNPLAYYEVRIAPSNEQLELPFGTNVNTFIQTDEANEAASIQSNWLLNKHNDRAQIWTLDTNGRAILRTVDTPFTELNRSILTSGIEPGVIALHNDNLDSYLDNQRVFHPLPLQVPSWDKWKETHWKTYAGYLFKR
ncbi:hypothetical protein DV702_16470 [Sporosarcina sp. PTS2304]|uniref:hypothetical protein n=1 Tax=Sporosarcina sp. PTS2304 TaxID=2283194 RepID=UPI000E0D10C4|nr:hypothetical protein [Sporosarcina sp. PTS2304]AXI01174.1 hypothetical protein DV702_16470 [Sporosarcina sp. PTS2304]